MTVLEAVKERRSIRNFLQKDIPPELIEKLIEAIIWAPSAGNLQARKFYFIEDFDVKKALADAALRQNFIARAPLVIVGCTNSLIRNVYGERGVHLYSIQDVSCSIMNLMLVAHELGLGTVWVGAFYEDEVSSILRLPPNLRPVAIVPVGYPEKVPSPPPRVSPDEAIVWIRKRQ
jgi:nitroreductase